MKLAEVGQYLSSLDSKVYPQGPWHCTCGEDIDTRRSVEDTAGNIEGDFRGLCGRRGVGSTGPALCTASIMTTFNVGSWPLVAHLEGVEAMTLQ